MILMAIDPGTEQSGWVYFDGARVLDSGTSPNAEVLTNLYLCGADALAVERFEARGMPISDDSIRTVIWTGRFLEAWRQPDEVRLVKRSAVKLALCGTSRAKDSNVRQAVIDRLGEPGKKANPGPTYGVKGHEWQALAVALVAMQGVE